MNFLLAWRALPESRPAGLARPPWRDLARSFVPTPIRLLTRVHDRRIALFLVLFFIFFAAFAVVEAMGTLYLGKRFGADELDSALVFGRIGLFIALTQAGPLGRLADSYGEVRLLINTPPGKHAQYDDYRLRQTAIAQRVSYTTTMSAAAAAVDAILALKTRKPAVCSLQEWHEVLRMELGVG